MVLAPKHMIIISIKLMHNKIMQLLDYIIATSEIIQGLICYLVQPSILSDDTYLNIDSYFDCHKTLSSYNYLSYKPGTM